MNEYVNFGTRRLPKSTKKKLVNDLFNGVSAKYDLMNDLMSLGLHRVWKKDFVKMLNFQPNDLILDLAGGTGDIAELMIKMYPSLKIIVCDISENMLEMGRKKFIDKNINGISWLCADAEKMPFASNSLDGCTISFGIRNVTDFEQAIHNIYRALKPDGSFFCMEFAKMSNGLLSRIYDCYSYKLIPKLGNIVAENKDAYRYLIESIRLFPAQEEFKHIVQNAGFSSVRYRNFSGGIVAVYSGVKSL